MMIFMMSLVHSEAGSSSVPGTHCPTQLLGHGSKEASIFGVLCLSRKQVLTARGTIPYPLLIVWGNAALLRVGLLLSPSIFGTFSFSDNLDFCIAEPIF